MQTRKWHLAGWLVLGTALGVAPATLSAQAVPPPPVVPQPPMIPQPPAPPTTATEPSSAATPTPAPEPAGDETSEKKEDEGPSFEFGLRGEEKCIAPYTSCDAKTEEGKIEVTPDKNTLTVTITGGVGANVWLGAHSEALQTFRLLQEFEVSCSDDTVHEMILTLDSKLIGFVRAKHKASACVQLASLTVTPVGTSSPILSVSHPLPCVGGNGGLCAPPVGSQSTEPLEAIRSQPLPLGTYLIDANFVLSATAEGFLDAYSQAIFTPEATELDPWEREHAPFAGDKKDGFGFTSVITASTVSAPPLKSEKVWKTVKKRLDKEKKEKKLAKQADPRLAAQPPAQPLLPQARNLPNSAPERVTR